MATTFLCSNNAAAFLGLSEKQFRRAIAKVGLEPLNFGTPECPKHFFLRDTLIEHKVLITSATGFHGKPKKRRLKLPVLHADV